MFPPPHPRFAPPHSIPSSDPLLNRSPPPPLLAAFENPNGDTNFFKQCAAFSKDPNGYRPVDMWVAEQGTGYEGPYRGTARGKNNSAACDASDVDLCAYGDNSTCPPYPGWPGAQRGGCEFEDELFREQLMADLREYDPASPDDKGLFIFWAPHVVHTPLQVPQSALAKFKHVQDWRRRRYLAMVNYIDGAVGEVIALIKSKGQMWNDTLVVFSSDNGGPVYAAGAAGANNFPLKGGKTSNWEGGIRVNAFVSGGLLPESRRGVKVDGLSTIWDWYSTFADVAGVTDVADAKAAKAGLPPVDSISLWPWWNGTADASPRKRILIGDENAKGPIVGGIIVDTRGSAVDGGGLLQGRGQGGGSGGADGGGGGGGVDGTLFGDAFGGSFGGSAVGGSQSSSGDRGDGDVAEEVGAAKGAPGLWKLLVGKVGEAAWQSESFPNMTTGNFGSEQCGEGGCLYRLDSDPCEYSDVHTRYAAMAVQLKGEVDAAKAGVFAPNRGTADPNSCVAAMTRWNGFWGPWVTPSAEAGALSGGGD